ncbi:MAG: hypothetical protein N2Z73_04360, partial [Endomicrobia bacterium]|nr:hypothetical protein [Endomicrobiia bacterium]
YNIYNFILPVRYNLYGYGFAEVGYNYKIKSEKERLTVTFSSSSVIADNLQLRFDLYYKKSFLRTYLLYDFTQSIVSRWYQRFKPIITDVNISYKKFNFGSNIIYCIDKSLIENLQILISYLSSYGEVSLVYGINSSKPGLHFVSPQLNLYVPDNYQLKLRASLNISKEKFEVLNTNMEFYKDLHCLETKIFCNIKKSLSGNISLPYIFELGGSIGFKFKPYVGSGGKISDINQRYFPWRE